ncbi:hypothetical protein OTB20_40370 [Streptomyces sp. H27-H1]|uniref:DUF6907 domain-containing protein n=1 Tax=Streptomyces sp. H27-H1 TaxID=2996461 RepID=UPI00226EFE74|nr:hypothetical protein [Streptomyces sp. H27-H1]MCY0932302.1 hypothetical protein [Streptomyces sp. H27-H1]
MSEFSAEMPELIPGPIVCPYWCSAEHVGLSATIDDGLVHVSPDVAVDGFTENPRTVLNLVSYETPRGARPPRVEVSTFFEDYAPDSHEVTRRSEVDALIAQLEQAASALRQWREAVPT